MPLSHTRHSMPSALPSSTSSSSSSLPSSLQYTPSTSSLPISKYHTLRRLLTKIHYHSPFSPDLLLTHCPPSITLPILSHLFLSFSPHLTSYFLSHNFLLTSSSFSLSSLYLLLLHLFSYHPPLTQAQFISERGYVEKKIGMLCDIIAMCVRKEEELAKQNEGEGAKGGRRERAGVGAGQGKKEGERRDREREKGEMREEERRADKENDKPTKPKPKRKQHKDPQPIPYNSFAQALDEPTSPPHPVPPSHPDLHVSFTSPTSPPLSPSSPPPSTDPLLSLHSQLQAIAGRTSGLTPKSSGLDDVMRRVERVERRVEEVVKGLEVKLSEVMERLKVLEERDKGEVKDETKGGREEEVGKLEEVKAEVGEGMKGGDVMREKLNDSDTSVFMDRMQARLAATANLLDNARRLRQGERVSQ